ncbi:hypothetical protein A3A49_01515 [Candidatus Curtissbacteria bacterium RIFCSPLOWO2_01_FULL_38_11b]|uniref:HTH luxR-type domain-containing protein n=1 Tax=Candidatus Curtissbacteria bacterium RIFCSPLOWO2_01_FULL_38_11b TaxID=1797725 RepID=A0A1F5H0S7_9BACT|nr:MAG: hypothetical protein A3A49_01515 [Candidatus Curtissbacteria bacterium RIFCSPLOWO2_01_FULL_38_11b]
MDKEGYRRKFGPEGTSLFTNRQLEMLQLAVKGVESSKDFSTIMGISLESVSSLKEHITQRLEERGVVPVSFRRAIAESIWRGLVDTSRLPTQTAAGLTDVEANLVAFITTGYDTNYIREQLHLTRIYYKLVKGSILKKLKVKNLNQAAAVTAIEMMRLRSTNNAYV